MTLAGGIKVETERGEKLRRGVSSTFAAFGVHRLFVAKQVNVFKSFSAFSVIKNETPKFFVR